MRFIKEKDYKALSKRAGSIIASQVILNPNCVLGLATGSSPLGLYEKIRQSTLDFSDRVSVNLDEYAGLSSEDEHSYHYFMNDNFFNYVNIFLLTYYNSCLRTSKQFIS